MALIFAREEVRTLQPAAKAKSWARDGNGQMATVLAQRDAKTSRRQALSLELATHTEDFASRGWKTLFEPLKTWCPFLPL
jgi:hypothetical protein